jgi:nucleoside-diphosphate-sugar epimerase
VVHFGFLRAIKSQGTSPSESTDATKRLLDMAEQAGVEHVVYVSGCLVYRLRPWTSAVIDEEAELDFDAGADPWLRARVDTDMVCRTFMDKPRPKVTILRPARSSAGTSRATWATCSTATWSRRSPATTP